MKSLNTRCLNFTTFKLGLAACLLLTCSQEQKQESKKQSSSKSTMAENTEFRKKTENQKKLTKYETEKIEVSFVLLGLKKDGDIFCQGFLMQDSIVATAKHCLQDKQLSEISIKTLENQKLSETLPVVVSEIFEASGNVDLAFLKIEKIVLSSTAPPQEFLGQALGKDFRVSMFTPKTDGSFQLTTEYGSVLGETNSIAKTNLPTLAGQSGAPVFVRFTTKDISQEPLLFGMHLSGTGGQSQVLRISKITEELEKLNGRSEL